MNNHKKILLSLSEHECDLLQRALSAAQLHPDASDCAKGAWSALGWWIDEQIKSQTSNPSEK